MELSFESYSSHLSNTPADGKQVLAHYDENEVVAYQAYSPAIAEFAVAHQHFGGPRFSYSRMSWIKPGFLWMMYRSGWAEKENQERILAISIGRENFEDLLAEAVNSSYKPKIYGSTEAWKAAMAASDVRVQWDPDHDPYGRKLGRRAVQLGLKGQILLHYGQRFIRRIEDITAFVKEQKSALDRGGPEAILLPVERVLQTGPIVRQPNFQ